MENFKLRLMFANETKTTFYLGLMYVQVGPTKTHADTYKRIILIFFIYDNYV